jgi:hypothetical protein
MELSVTPLDQNNMPSAAHGEKEAYIRSASACDMKLV